MKKYRKKPVVIEAMKFEGNYESYLTIWKWANSVAMRWDNTTRKFNIRTLEGVHTASPGDMIIKGVKGEFYPCKPDIFAETYEEAVP